MHRFLEVEMCGHRRQVAGVVIHVMAAAGLSGAAMTTPVVGYDAIAVLEEEQHLRVPVIGAQWPAVREHDWLSGTPILEVDLRSVLNCDSAHFLFSWFVVRRSRTARLCSLL